MPFTQGAFIGDEMIKMERGEKRPALDRRIPLFVPCSCVRRVVFGESPSELGV